MRASDWDERYAASDRVWTSGPNVFVERECADLPPGRALDLASGEGRNAIWLARRGWQVTAVDFSAVASQRAARLAGEVTGPGAVTAVTADVLEYQPDSGTFDLALLAYLQLPTDERRQVVRAAAGALAPGGVLLVVAHHLDNLGYGVGGPQEASVLFTLDDIVADLAGTGLVVQAARCERRPVQAAVPEGHQHDATTGETRDALDVVVRARRAAREENDD